MCCIPPRKLLVLPIRPSLYIWLTDRVQQSTTPRASPLLPMVMCLHLDQEKLPVVRRSLSMASRALVSMETFHKLAKASCDGIYREVYGCPPGTRWRLLLTLGLTQGLWKMMGRLLLISAGFGSGPHRVKQGPLDIHQRLLGSKDPVWI